MDYRSAILRDFNKKQEYNMSEDDHYTSEAVWKNILGEVKYVHKADMDEANRVIEEQSAQLAMAEQIIEDYRKYILHARYLASKSPNKATLQYLDSVISSDESLWSKRNEQ